MKVVPLQDVAWWNSLTGVGVSVHTYKSCLHSARVKIIWADFLFFYCSQAARPLLVSLWPSAQWLDADKTIGHSVFSCLLHHARWIRVQHNVTPNGCIPEGITGLKENNSMVLNIKWIQPLLQSLSQNDPWGLCSRVHFDPKGAGGLVSTHRYVRLIHLKVNDRIISKALLKCLAYS